MTSELDDPIRAMVDADNARTAAETAYQQARTAVIDALRRIRANVETPNDPQFLAVLRHLYWQHPGLSAADLAAAAGLAGASKVSGIVGPVPSGVRCGWCELELRRTSRSWNPPGGSRPGSLILCPACERRERDNSYRAREIGWRRAEYIRESAATVRGTDLLSLASVVLAYPPITVTSHIPPEEDRDGFWRAYDIAQRITRRFYETPSADRVEVSVRIGHAENMACVANRAIGWDTARACAIVGPITSDAPTLVLARFEWQVRAAKALREAEARRLFPDSAAVS